MFTIYSCHECGQRRVWGEGEPEPQVPQQAIWLKCQARCGVTRHVYAGLSELWEGRKWPLSNYPRGFNVEPTILAQAGEK